MIIDKTMEPKIKDLMEEYRRLWENALNYGSSILPPVQQDRLTAIQRELERLGLRIGDANLDAVSGEVEIVIEEPDPSMTPEEIKKYDDWFLEANGIKAD